MISARNKKIKPGSCEPGLVRRRGGADDTFQRGTNCLQWLPNLRRLAAKCAQHDKSMQITTDAHNRGLDMTAMRRCSSEAGNIVSAIPAFPLLRRQLSLCGGCASSRGCGSKLLRVASGQ